MPFKKMKSGKIEPSSENRMIGTNIIANNPQCIDFWYMNKNFDFGIVHIGTEPGLKYEDAAKKAAKALDQSRAVIAGFTYRKKKKRFIMTHKGDLEKISFNEAKTLKLEKVTLPFERNFQFIQQLILGNALPALMTKDVVKERNCFHNGNSYFRAIDGKTQEINGQQVNICQTVEVKIESDWSLSTDNAPVWQVLSSGGVTFTNFDSVREFKPRSRKMAQHRHGMLKREIFKIHPKGLLIPREDASGHFIEGDYVRGNLKENGKNLVNAYVLSHDRSKSGDIGQDPSLTRGGMAFTFRKDLGNTYDKNFDIKLKKLNFDVHYRGRNIASKKKKEQQAILAALAANFNIRIINQAEDRNGEKRKIEPGHIDQLHRLTRFRSQTEYDKEIEGNLRFLTADIQGPNNKPELVLLVTNTKKSYSKTKADPYITFKNSYGGVSQNTEFFNLFQYHKMRNEAGEVIEIPILNGQVYKKQKKTFSDSCPTLDTILAQLLIKAEVFYEQILVDRRCGELPEEYTIVYPHRTKVTEDEESDILDDDNEDDNLYETPFSGYDYSYARIIGDKIEFGILNEERLNKIDQFLDKSRVFVFGKPYRTQQGNQKYGHHRSPLMIDEATGKYMIFVATKAHAMPKHDVLEKMRHGLEGDANKHVPRNWVEGYITESEHPENDRIVTAKLLDKRDESGCVPENFSFDDFKECRKKLAISERAYIYNVIAEDLDIFWHSNIKSKEGNYLVYHQDGFSFSTDANRYFAGRVGSFKAGAQAGFCKIYEIINVGGIPENAHEWFITTSVRNGQTTVYPWIVQHVKEYARMAQFIDHQTMEDVTIIESKPIKLPDVIDNAEDIDREMTELEF